jgi:hypothetical protein
MNNWQTTSSVFSADSQTRSRSTPAWIAIGGLAFLITICLVLGVASVLSILFPLGSFAVGVFLLLRYPVLYVGFTWWLWFLGPLIKRLIDYRSGFDTFGGYTLTPLLVTSISLITLIQYFSRLRTQSGLPFLLCLGSVLYGFVIRVLRQPIAWDLREILLILAWLSPILFGFHLFVHWRNYPTYRQQLQQTFFWGVLVMGVYGVLQFLVAPEWDRFFLITRREEFNLSWMGAPVPLEIRVWSTMSNPITFSCNLMSGLLLLFMHRGLLRIVAGVFGYLAFLLSLARTGWYSWVIALLLYFFSLKRQYQRRMIVSFMMLALVAVPLMTVEPFSSAIASRFQSFSNIEEDASYEARVEQFNQAIDFAVSEVVGQGLIGYGGIPTGARTVSTTISSQDNGHLAILVSLGWIGTLPYVTGIVLLLGKLFLNSSNRNDMFIVAARAIAFASLARAGTSAIAFDEYAMPIWCFLGIAVAAHKYYQTEETLARQTSRLVRYE